MFTNDSLLKYKTLKIILLLIAIKTIKMNELILTLFLLLLIELNHTFQPKAIISLNKNDIQNEWHNFKKTHKRIYLNSSHENDKYEIFKKNLEKINDQNKKFINGKSTHSFGITKFADMTSEEFMEYVNKGLKKIRTTSKSSSFIEYKRSAKTLPSSIDWRTLGYITPIKDQGNCGSCWAFSAVSAIESFNFKTNDVLSNFSEQNLVDCVYLSFGYRGHKNFL